MPPLRILVIAPDDTLRVLISALFQTRGAEVTATRDGRGAIEQLCESRFDAVVMDGDFLWVLGSLGDDLEERTVMLVGDDRSMPGGRVMRMRKPFFLDELADAVLGAPVAAQASM